MPTPDAKFNGLAESYDRTRPRYPIELITRAIAGLQNATAPVIVDAGAGTGIALEALIPLIPATAVVSAVDISSDMVDTGRAKFPQVTWAVGTAEEYLDTVSDVDLVIAAQAYQWMNREVFLDAARRALRPGGTIAIIQNNRNHSIPGFAADYESLLERYSPGYSRSYRAFDIESELAAVASTVEVVRTTWHQDLATDDFVTMSSSSTQAQRAVSAVGDTFLDAVRTLCDGFAVDGVVSIPYESEGFYGTVAR